MYLLRKNYFTLYYLMAKEFLKNSFKFFFAYTLASYTFFIALAYIFDLSKLDKSEP